MIVVPTYWTWGRERADGPVDAVYDHPTPVDGEGTLPRLLQSLSGLEGPQFGVLVLTAATHPRLEQTAAAQVERLLAPFRDHYPIAQATEADAAVIRQRYPGLADHVLMRGYAGVRNLQLLLSHVLGAEVVVALDDDEVVAPDYLRRALQFVGREHGGERLLGLAGFYLDANGSVLLPERPRTGNIFLDKSAIMNEGTQALQARAERLVLTPVAFGGSMVFHRDLFTRVGFDPGITRGEDIDYLINARLAGQRFWLDKELVITHLPPGAYGALPYPKLAQDIYRFLYERQKLRLAGMDPAHFDPYPGCFLRDDVEEQALAALQYMATAAEVARSGSPEVVLAQAQRHAQEAPPHYFTFAQSWPRLVEALGGDRELGNHWQARLANVPS